MLRLRTRPNLRERIFQCAAVYLGSLLNHSWLWMPYWPLPFIRRVVIWTSGLCWHHYHVHFGRRVESWSQFCTRVQECSQVYGDVFVKKCRNGDLVLLDPGDR